MDCGKLECAGARCNFPARGCSCGPNLSYCHRRDEDRPGEPYAFERDSIPYLEGSARRLLWEEPARLFAFVVTRDAPFSDLVLGDYTVAPRRLRHVYVRWGRMNGDNAAKLDATSVDVVFTAIESDAARELEPRYAQTTPVLSTASAFRYEVDVPILIPGVNLGHAKLIESQRRRRDWKGFIAPQPNCTATGLAITLAPLHERFGVKNVIMTSLQACSGAGRSPGVRRWQSRARSLP